MQGAIVKNDGWNVAVLLRIPPWPGLDTAAPDVNGADDRHRGCQLIFAKKLTLPSLHRGGSV